MERPSIDQSRPSLNKVPHFVSTLLVPQTAVSLQVVKDNLCKQHVSAIVNPTNAQLDLTGGVSWHIAKSVGPWLKSSCQDLLNKKSPGQRDLDVGTAEVTCCKGSHNGPGSSTPFANIIHAVGPHYHGGAQAYHVVAHLHKWSGHEV